MEATETLGLAGDSDADTRKGPGGVETTGSNGTTDRAGPVTGSGGPA